MVNLSPKHFKELNKIWGYLLKFLYIFKNYNCLGIGEKTLYIIGYCDFSCGNNINNAKSTLLYIFSINNKKIFNPIS